MSNTFEAWINPLQWTALDHSQDEMHINENTLLKFLANPSNDFSLQSAIRRYKSINGFKHLIFVAPNHNEFLQKLVWPLRSAKSSYVIGNFISTIAQSGMVSEMVALLWYEISGFSANEIRRFEKHGQEKRIKVLREQGLIGDNEKEYFEKVKNIRRKYLHFFSQSHTSIESDALDAFEATLALVAKLLDISFDDGKVGLRPSLMRYVEKHERD